MSKKFSLNLTKWWGGGGGGGGPGWAIITCVNTPFSSRTCWTIWPGGKCNGNGKAGPFSEIIRTVAGPKLKNYLEYTMKHVHYVTFSIIV